MLTNFKKSIVRFFCVFTLGAAALTVTSCAGNTPAPTLITSEVVSDRTIITTQAEDSKTDNEDVVADLTEDTDAAVETSLTTGLTDDAGATDCNGIVLPAVEMQVLLEKSDVKITALGMKNQPEKGACLILSVENNSNKNIWVSCHNLAVNNYMVETTLYTVVAAGETKEDILPLDTAYLASAGISSIGELDIVFGVYDNDSYDKLWTSDPVTMQTSDFPDMDAQPDLIENAVSVFDQEGIRVSYYAKSSDEEKTIIHLLIENNSEIETDVIFNNFLINGQKLIKSSSGQTLAGTKILVEAELLAEELVEIGVSDVQTFGFEVEIYKSPEYDQVLMNVKVDFPVD